VVSRSTSGGALALEERARRIGHHLWLEMRLFELLGGWVATIPELAVKPVLAAHSRHHGWHAELWHGHLPRLAGRDPGELVVPRHEGLVDALGALDPDGVPADGTSDGAGPGGAGEAPATVPRLVGVYRVVLPRLIAAYRDDLANASPVADAPVMRSLRFMLADDLDDWQEGEALVHELVRSPDQAQRAAAHQAHVESLVVAAGGIVGPASPPA
jgi:hypothetical protein